MSVLENHLMRVPPHEPLQKEKATRTKKTGKRTQTPYPPSDRYKMSQFLQTYGKNYTPAQFDELQESLSLKKNRHQLGQALGYMLPRLNQSFFKPEQQPKPMELMPTIPNNRIEIAFHGYEVDFASKKLIFHL